VEPHGPRWLIAHNDIRLNHGHGIQVSSDGVIVRANRLHHNGQLGIGAGGVNGQLVEDNEIDHNNTAAFSSRWEAGGAKWAETRNLTVRRNRSHDNGGPGLWTDINCVDVLYEGNSVSGNAGGGIRHEISYRAVIRDNEVSGNGGSEALNGWGPAGIEVAGSSEVEVAHNTVTGNANGIVLAQQHRPEHPSAMGPHDLSDVWVHDNLVTMAQGVTGMVNDTGNDVFYEQGIRFERNTYRMPDPASRSFAWRDGPWSFSDWQRLIKQDVAGVQVDG
jgi:parallel beta-helix repeat protein